MLLLVSYISSIAAATANTSLVKMFTNKLDNVIHGKHRYIFFKLQDSVFLLLPVDGEFYGVMNNYRYFIAFIHCLFWGQTIVSACQFKETLTN